MTHTSPISKLLILVAISISLVVGCSTFSSSLGKALVVTDEGLKAAAKFFERTGFAENELSVAQAAADKLILANEYFLSAQRLHKVDEDALAAEALLCSAFYTQEAYKSLATIGVKTPKIVRQQLERIATLGRIVCEVDSE